MERFKLTEAQVEYILETKLRQLARLEEMKIKEEMDKLTAEKQKLETLLSSETRLKTFIKKEIMADAKTYGDERRCQVIERAEAVAMPEEDLTPSTPMTVILSKMGWVKAAVGADVDAEHMAFKGGDASGRSNQAAVFLTNLGRVYTVDIKDLPSARGQGDPLSSKAALQPNEQALFVLTGVPEDYFLLATSTAYGFICPYVELETRLKAGKALMTIDPEAKLLQPQKLANKDSDLIAVVSLQGKFLLYPAKELPILARGKGNKLINIAAAKLDVGLDGVAAAAVVPENAGAVLH